MVTDEKMGCGDARSPKETHPFRQGLPAGSLFSSVLLPERLAGHSPPRCTFGTRFTELLQSHIRVQSSSP